MNNLYLLTGRIGLFSLLLFAGLPLLAQAPANDDCENAQPVMLGEVISGSTASATVENVNYAGTNCSSPAPNDTDDAGIWFSFVAPADPINIIVDGDFDTEVAVLAGGCQTLDCVAFNDDGGPGLLSRISNLQLTEGETYLVFLEGFAGASGMFVVEACTSGLSCNDLTVTLDETGMGSVTPAMLSMGTCDDVDLTASQTDFDCTEVGTSIDVTVSQPDGNGGMNTCVSVVTVQDTLGPVISQTNFINVRVPTSMVPQACPGNTIFVDEGLNQPRLVSEVIDFFEASFPNGLPLAFFTMLFEDNCTEDEDVTVLITSVENTILPNGSDSIILNGFLIDEFGNRSILDTATIVLVDDTAPEIVSCVTDTTIFLDENGTASIAPGELLVTTDNCGFPSPTLGDPLVAFDCTSAGETFTFEEVDIDASGNVSEVCTINVTVQDTLGPVISQTNFINVRVSTSMVEQACPGNTIFVDEGLDQPRLVSEVLDFFDSSFPNGLPLAFFTMLFEDNCTEDEDITVLITSVENTILPNGSDSIILNGFLIDEYGNRSVLDTATIVLIDDTDPELACEDITVFIDENGTATVTDTSLAILSLSDNCVDSAAIDISLVAPELGCDGLTGTATLTATDASGNSAECTIGLTALDTIAPTAVCADVTVELDETGNASVSPASAGSAVTEVAGSLDDTDPQFARPNGNGLSCSTTANADHFYDVFNFTIDAEDMYTFSMPSLVGPDFYFLLYEGGFDPAAPCDNFIIGDDDANGTEPEIMIQLTLVPGDYSLVTTSFSGNAVEGAYTYSISSDNGGNVFEAGGSTDVVVAIDNGSTDNCGELTFELDVMDFTCDNVGENVVTLTVTDASGNTDECTATVTVEDNIDPVVTTTDQIIVLNDDNLSQTLMPSDLVTATDNCGDAGITFEFDRPLTFDGDDIGENTVTITVTDANGNEVVVTVTVVVTFDQPDLACIGEINLTLNDECQGLLIPQMLLTGNTGLLDAFDLEITVMDDDPSNGPIVDGCGSFQYMISDASRDDSPTIGFTGAFDEDNFEVSIYDFFDAPNGPIPDAASATVDFTQSSLTITTQGPIFGTADSDRFVALVEYQFTEDGTVSFDYNFTGNDPGFDGGVILYNFEGVEVERILSTDQPATGSGEIEIGPGNSLTIFVNDDGFSSSLTEVIPQVLTITNFVFQPAFSPLALDFETCWGIVNAEDKTPPAVVATPNDVALLCVDLDDNNLSTLSNAIDKCYRVSAATGATVPGSMSSALRARLFAGGTSPLVPTFTDGCADEIEVCVNDVVVFGDDPSCDDVVITRTFTATEISTCTSIDANPSVETSFTLTFERPTLDDLTTDNIDSVVEYERCGTANPTRADYPAPRSSDYPFLAVGDRTFPLNSGEAVCNIGVTYADGPAIVTCPFTYKFIRTYTVIDWCDPGDIRTFTQVVKVGDTTAPVFFGPSGPTNANGDLVYGTNAGNICAAYLRLDDVSAVDNCSGTNVDISAAIYPNGDLGGTPIGAFNVFPGGTPELSTAIPVGRHLLRYTFEDECGNADFEDFFFVVEDQTPPVAICEDGLNVSITGGTGDGFAVLTAATLDNGSYDDCSDVALAIARVDANDLAIGAYADQITLTCADLGTVRVGLRVTDALGNENFCWLDVLVEDKLAPTCVAPGDVVITCDEYNTTLPADIMDATDETLDALFGTAAGVDNCGTTITQRISGDVNSCGVGSFVRTFTSTDDAGFTNANNCTQNIRVDGVHDYRLTFPVDVSSDCAVVPEYDGVGAEELACDLITTTSDVDTLRTIDAGDECFKLRITYDVINWCEYNSFGEPYLVPRDGNGVNNRQRRPRDLEADPLYVNVLPGATLTTTDDDRAFMTLFTDRVFSPNAPQRDQPIDDNLLSDGDDNDYGDNDVDSRGFFRYVQFVKIYDEVAPEITFTEPAECFAGNNEDCSATVELTFTALDACSDAVVGVELDANYLVTTGFVRTADITSNTTNDGEGNYTVSLTNVPVGEHAIRVRASDGCGNFDVQIIEFCVEADKSPTPICIQTLTVTLMDDGNGGGIAAIWASDFIASPIVDCFGNPVTKYSLYRTSDAGANDFVPAVGQLGIDDINCADRGDLSVRVYAFDDNGSTPDFCEVVVEVQDNAPWCGGSTGDLSGLVLTPADEALEGVLMTLTGGMDATTTTDANGAFEFRNVQYNQDYTVQPSYEAAFSNRDVKTSDLVAAISDILGTQPFDNGYDYIAADVNRDGEHDVRDVVMSSRAILGITNGYDLGNWTFVTAETEFNLSNPYGAEFPEVYNVNDLQGSFRAADFVAIMMGDLVQGNGRSAQNLNTEDVRLAAGQTHTVVLDGAHLAGFQGTIELAAGLELVSADYVGEGGLNLNRVAEGLVAVALRNEASLTLEVRATEAGLLSELISLNDAITVREGVAANGLSSGLGLAFNGAALAPATAPNALYQNTPNPVLDVTSISFELATAGAATLTIQDAAGRLILTRQLDAAAGLNRVDLDNIQATGVLTYTLTSGDFTASKKMVVVK